MIANILIAIGFFFVGLTTGICLTANAYRKALNEWKKEMKHLIVYEI